MPPPEQNGTQRERRRLAFVGATFHQELIDGCRSAFVEAAEEQGVPRDHVEVFSVPGAFELPLFVSRLARSGRFDAVAAAGLVVDNGIYRPEYVAQTVVSALMDVQLEHDLPVVSVVLTPHHLQGPEHVEFFMRNFVARGADAARACVGALDALDALAGVESPPR